MNRKGLLFFVVLVFALGNTSTAVAAVHALFDLRAPTSGPFPSDWFTVAEPGNLTRFRIDMPRPDCAVRQSDCEDLEVINTLDGFNLQPRLSIPFDGSIDVATVTSETVFLVSLGSTVRDREDENCDGDCEGDGTVVGINQIVWDTFTNTLHVQSNELLDQHTRYALIATRGIRDLQGRQVEASEAFRQFRERVRGSYRRALLNAIHAARRRGVEEREMATASVFTTQSVTSVLEKMRDQIKAAEPEPADFQIGTGNTRTVFGLDEVTGIAWDAQTGADPPTFTRMAVDYALLRIIPGAVGTVAFGKFISPDYEEHPGEFIPPIATRTGQPLVRGRNEVYFNLFLPSGSKPPNGWPIAIFGHGNFGNKNNSLSVAATMASHGIATIAINAAGHGFGPLGTLTVNETNGDSVALSAGGRGIDQNGDHAIDGNEGMASAPPRTLLFFTDGVRQTVADLMQLVRVIQVGVDVDGDGTADLDASRIYYFGQSLGGNYGTVFLGVEPTVQTGVLNVPAGPIVENRRLSSNARPVLGQLLSSRVPSLINAPGITRLGGRPVGPPHFNENFSLRDGIPLSVQLADGTAQIIQSPVINTVAGAMAIQEVVENNKWAGCSGDSVAYAPYLRKNPLVGVAAKSVIYQFAKTDQNAPNPNTTAILRAGNLADRATFYRHDVAYAEIPGLPTNPHPFLSTLQIEAARPIALAAQRQIAVFFETDGAEIIQPEPARFFEVPIHLPLPEDLNFIP